MFALSSLANPDAPTHGACAAARPNAPTARITCLGGCLPPTTPLAPPRPSGIIGTIWRTSPGRAVESHRNHRYQLSNYATLEYYQNQWYYSQYSVGVFVEEVLPTRKCPEFGAVGSGRGALP